LTGDILRRRHPPPETSSLRSEPPARVPLPLFDRGRGLSASPSLACLWVSYGLVSLGVAWRVPSFHQLSPGHGPRAINPGIRSWRGFGRGSCRSSTSSAAGQSRLVVSPIQIALSDVLSPPRGIDSRTALEAGSLGTPGSRRNQERVAVPSPPQPPVRVQPGQPTSRPPPPAPGDCLPSLGRRPWPCPSIGQRLSSALCSKPALALGPG